MERILGDITFKRVLGTPTLRRSIEREIRGWSTHEALDPSAPSISYHVILEREGAAVETRCRIFIHSKRFAWEGSEFAKDPLKALRLALSNLRRQGRPVASGRSPDTRKIELEAAAALAFAY